VLIIPSSWGSQLDSEITSTPFRINYQNDIKHDMQKPKPQSTQAPFVQLFCMKLFLFSNTIRTFFETTLLMKTNMDQRSKYTLMKRYKKI
jgi:hypothetical protein